MKKILIAFVISLAWMTTAQAQYQELIDLKINQLVMLQGQVTTSALSQPEKDAASDVLADNLVQLTQHRNEVDVTKLQTLETSINQINAQLATRIIEMKKAKIEQKLDQLASVIAGRKDMGKNTTALEGLWEQMNTALQSL